MYMLTVAYTRFVRVLGRVVQAVDHGRPVLLQQRLSASGVRQHGCVPATQGPATSPRSTRRQRLLAAALDRSAVVRLVRTGLASRHSPAALTHLLAIYSYLSINVCDCVRNAGRTLRRRRGFSTRCCIGHVICCSGW